MAAGRPLPVLCGALVETYEAFSVRVNGAGRYDAELAELAGGSRLCGLVSIRLAFYATTSHVAYIYLLTRSIFFCSMRGKKNKTSIKTMSGTMMYASPAPKTGLSRATPFMQVMGPYDAPNETMVALHKARFDSAPSRSSTRWYVGVDTFDRSLMVQASIDSSGTLWNLSSLHEGRGNASEFVRQLTGGGIVKKLFVRGNRGNTDRLLRFYEKLGFRQ